MLGKAGAIIPTWPVRDHVDKGWSPEDGLRVYPAGNSQFTLYEDDGTSLGYRKGEFARTLLSCEADGKRVKLTVGGRQGKYAGMPATRDFTASVRLTAKPQTVSLDGAAVSEFGWDAAASVATVKIPGCGEKARVLSLE